jgi:hypothetical protein
MASVMSATRIRLLWYLATLLTIFAVVVYIGYLAIYVVYAVELFQWPFDYDQGEGFELHDAILYSQGEWPYRDNAAFPFYASNYPPLFHLLIVPLLPILGPRLVAGRLVSFVATLITAGTIVFVIRRNIGDSEQGWLGNWFIPLISGLGFLASNYVYQIGPLSRMHMTLVMFETLAIAFIAEFEDPRHGTRNLILGLAMLFLAGYTKQTAVFTVAAAISYVLLRDVRKGLIAGAGLAVTAGIVFWLINIATDGEWWVNIIQANVNEFDYRQTLFLFRQWFRLHTLFVVLAVGLFVHELFWDRLSAYSLWFFFALGVGALSGKWGAGFGYFNTAVAAACLTFGLSVGKLWKGAKSRTFGLGSWLSIRALLAVVIPVLCLAQAHRMLHLPTAGPVFGPLSRALGVDDKLVYGTQDSLAPTHCVPIHYHDAMGYTQLGHLLTPEDYAAGVEIMSQVHAAQGPVFSEEAMFSILAGKPVVTNPTQLLNLYNNGLLDTSTLIDQIHRQTFDLVIFRAQFYPAPVLQAIGQNYQPVDHVCMNGFTYHLLWPRRRLDRTSRLSEDCSLR